MTNSKNRQAIIIGAGPAGLTAAYELIKRSDYKVLVLEKEKIVGGLSATIKYKGNRMDIGGHRFFTKSDRVMKWWQSIMPIETDSKQVILSYQNQQKRIHPKIAKHKSKNVLLVRNRVSRIYYDYKFYDYPVSLTLITLKQLGFVKSLKILTTYIKSSLSPIHPEMSLEDYYINSFGYELYNTFFKSYTKKLWGKDPNQIEPEWGRQRAKSLSLKRVIIHAIKPNFLNDKSHRQKTSDTSLIQKFLYPSYGPGHMWELVQKRINKSGGSVKLQHEVTKITYHKSKVKTVHVRNNKTNKVSIINADIVLSTMPISTLIPNMKPQPNNKLTKIASNLEYRNFITVGLLLSKLQLVDAENRTLPDNWIYIHDPRVDVLRIQIFNNWSPYLVKNHDYVWIGLEYTCNDSDELWKKTDKEIIEKASNEIEKIGLAYKQDILDATVYRAPKAYPGYYGSYKNFSKIKEFINKIDNLYPIGRNGMHKYNNQNHSMLTAMLSVDNILTQTPSKESIWEVNTESDYHEEKK